MKAKITLLVAVAAVLAAALVPASLAGPSKGSSATVAVARSQLGRILVDGRGHTLYLFEKDMRRRSSCYGACAAAWPPLITSGKPRAMSGVRASLLGRTKRKDGRWQVTYNRHPLYMFVQDTNRGQAKGQGVDAFGAEWYVVSPAGSKLESAGGASSSSAPGGYGPYGP
jgi:predicted lipoprotein with Yx(FWY)xxD motif